MFLSDVEESGNNILGDELRQVIVSVMFYEWHILRYSLSKVVVR
jgi:hypothetical protein